MFLSWLAWLVAKARLRVGLAVVLTILTLVLLSRPLFYAVLAKSFAITLRLLLRRSVGLMVLLVDTILDEAATSLEASLLTAPSAAGPPNQVRPQFDMQPPRVLHDYVVRILFAFIGLLIGHRLPRVARVDRNNPPLDSAWFELDHLCNWEVWDFWD